MQNKLDNLNQKNKVARNTLSNLKEKARKQTQLHMASTLVTPKPSDPSSNDSISTVSSAELKPLHSSIKPIQKYQGNNSNLTKQKEKKRLRNQRQRANRKKRKLDLEGMDKERINEDSPN